MCYVFFVCMETFVGIDCVHPYLLDYQQQYFSDLKITGPLHITLKYLGDVGADELPPLIQKLKKINTKPFTLNTSTIATFNNPLSTRLLFVAVAHNKQLHTLQQKITRVLKDTYAAEQSYTPHVTIARSNAKVSVYTYPSPLKTNFRVTHFCLYQKGADGYKIVHRFQLK